MSKLAGKIKVHRSTIARFESGENVDFKTVDKIVNGLGLRLVVSLESF